MIPPGQTLGLVGGGQLGRMFTLRAREMGYEVVVLEPDPLSPAGAVATRHIRSAYDDRAALEDLARSAAAVTTEFENVPAAASNISALTPCAAPRPPPLPSARTGLPRRHSFDRPASPPLILRRSNRSPTFAEPGIESGRRQC